MISIRDLLPGHRQGQALRRIGSGLTLSLLCWSGPVAAHHDFNGLERLANDRPEAWAMNYLSATSLMTSVGVPEALPAGQWGWAVDLAQIPRLSDAQRRVGFDGLKLEDLNKSPVFGRLRAQLGLPGGWQIELGYTPPIEIDGARPRDLFALALSRSLWQGEQMALALRLFGQHGQIIGDVTCPAELAIGYHPTLNPYGCQAPSRDRFEVHHYGLSLSASGAWRNWRWHTELGLLRTESSVQVDALVFDIRDRSRLIGRGRLPILAFGIGRPITRQWHGRIEWLHVPIDVRRAGVSGNEPLNSVRLQLRYRWD